MAGRIPVSGSVSIGDGAGDDRSLNKLRNIKRATTTNSEMAMSTLRDWFRAYVNPTGDAAGNFPDSGNEIAVSDFRDMRIWGCAVRLNNEDTSTYANTNNGKVQAYGLYGTGDYCFSVNGGTAWNCPVGSAIAEFSQSSYNFDSDTVYTLTVMDETSPTVQFDLKFQVGYGSGTAYLEGTTSCGTDEQKYYVTNPSSSVYSDYSYFYVAVADPEGTTYG